MFNREEVKKIVNELRDDREMENLLAEYRLWIDQGTSLEPLNKFLKLNGHVQSWFQSIFVDFETHGKNQQFAHALQCWKNSAEKTDRVWMELFAHLVFDKVEQPSWFWVYLVLNYRKE